MKESISHLKAVERLRGFIKLRLRGLKRRPASKCCGMKSTYLAQSTLVVVIPRLSPDGHTEAAAAGLGTLEALCSIARVESQIC